MRVFLSTVGKTLILLIALAFLLEWGFSYCHTNPVYPRNKIAWIKSIDSEEKIDYAFFGSSRCINHVNTVQIDEATDLNGYNFGYAASNPFEVKLAVMEFLKEHNAEKIFVQVDMSYNELLPDTLAMADWIPYMKDGWIRDQFTPYLNDINVMSFIPFYRYAKYESKIGFRNTFFTMLGKKADFTRLQGFEVHRNGNNFPDPNQQLPLNKIENRHITEIISHCQEQGVELYFFTSPVLGNRVDYSYLSEHLPHYEDFSNVYQDETMFNNYLHITGEGAADFTDLLIETYFK